MTIIRVLLLLAVVPAILLQFSCTASEPKKEVRQPVTVVPEPVEPRERVRRALDLFQAGEAEAAREQLTLALQDRPRYRLARHLLEQFEVDPEATLGAESFEYRVQPGETLSLISERFLGDPLQFIVLARYNGLSEPGRLEAGQVLRIPERYHAQPAPAPESEESPADEEGGGTGVAETPQAAGSPEADGSGQIEEVYREAHRLFQKGDFAGAVSQLEPVADTPEARTGKLHRLLVDAYGAHAAQLIGKERWQDARKVLARAARLEPGDGAIVSQLAMVEDRIEGRRLYFAGQVQASKGDYEKAYALYRDAAVYDPENATYAQAKKRTGHKLAERYHRQAMDYYHREQLEKAKAYWKKVLEVDPGNRIAPGYLSKVEELQQRMREMD